MRTFPRRLIAAVLWLAVVPSYSQGQTNSKQIMTRPAAELVELLGDPNASVFEKAKACQQLAVVGSKDAVPALAALLPDEKLNVYARFGLEAIPDPTVDEALRNAATKLEGRPLVGVIDSIGQRKDAQALDLLKGLLGNSDPSVAAAAAGALGRIGTPEAAECLLEHIANDNPPVRAAVVDACLTCAERLAASDKKEETEVAGLLYAFLAKGVVPFSQEEVDIPKHVKVAALGGLFRLKTLLEQGEAVDLLAEQIRSQDEAFFNLGLAVTRELPGDDVTTALAAELEKLPPERQALLLRALGDRKEPLPLPALLAAGKSDSSAVRQAAVCLLAKRADPSAVAALLDAALGDDATIAQIAKEGLGNLSGQEVDAVLVGRLADANANAKVVLFELAGRRRIATAMPNLREALADADASVRLAAIAALGQLIELDDMDLLIGKALAADASAETTAAQNALRTAALRMADRDGCAAKLAEHVDGASAANRTYLLELLGEVSGKKALEAVAAGVSSSDPAVKDAATRVLGEWLNADAAPVLLEIAKTDGDGKYQIRALRGYIRIARQLQLPAETKLAMFRTAMEVAGRDQEKQLALDILTRIPSPTSLDSAVSYLSVPALKDAAADAAVKIAAKLVAQEPKAVAEAMQKVVDANPGGDLVNRAKQLLGQAKAD